MYINNGTRRIDAIKAETDAIIKNNWFRPARVLNDLLAKVDIYLQAEAVCHSWLVTDICMQNRETKTPSTGSLRRDKVETEEDKAWCNQTLGRLLLQGRQSVLNPEKQISQGGAIPLDQADKLDCIAMSLDWLWPCFDYINQRLRPDFRWWAAREAVGEKLSKKEAFLLRFIRRVINTADLIYDRLLAGSRSQEQYVAALDMRVYLLKLANCLANKVRECLEPSLGWRHKLSNKWFLRCTETERLLAPAQIAYAKGKEKARYEQLANADRTDLDETTISLLCEQLLGIESSIATKKGQLVDGMPGWIGSISASTKLDAIKAGRVTQFPARIVQLTLTVMPLNTSEVSKAEPIALEKLSEYVCEQLLTRHERPSSRKIILPDLSSGADLEYLVAEPIEVTAVSGDETFAFRLHPCFTVTKPGCESVREPAVQPLPKWYYLSYTKSQLFADVLKDLDKEGKRQVEVWTTPVGKSVPVGTTTQSLDGGAGITLVFPSWSSQFMYSHFNDLRTHDLFLPGISQFADADHPIPQEMQSMCISMLEVLVMRTFTDCLKAQPISFRLKTLGEKEVLEILFDTSEIQVDDKTKLQSHLALRELARRRSVHLKCLNYSRSMYASK